ncbi:hypothetical protein PIB30_035463, partial [Stylosanthes scabra]|nr:hypothetical protein [Stylosanthes scabra]
MSLPLPWGARERRSSVSWCRCGSICLGAYGARVIAGLVNEVLRKGFSKEFPRYLKNGSFSEGIDSCLGRIDSHDRGLKENMIRPSESILPLPESIQSFTESKDLILTSYESILALL